MTSIKTNCSRLAEMRIRQGLTCSDLAAKIGVTRSCVATIERGTAKPGPATAKKIVEALNVPYDCIFSIVEGE